MSAVTAQAGTYQGKTAEQWRAEAQASERSAYDSFERCGNDGFLSQWCSGKSAQEYLRNAELAEANGMWEFEALFYTDGTLATRETITGDYGTSWYIARPRPGGKRYVNTSKARKGERRLTADEAKGFRIGTIRCAAIVKAAGDIVSLNYYFAPDPHSEAYEIVDNGTDRTCYEDWSN